MQLPDSITIREVGPREGFQTISKVIPTAHKLELIEALAKTGVRQIEVTSFVRPDRVPQMADAEDLARSLVHYEGVRYSALYLNKAGFERAEACKRISNDAWLYTAASSTFLKRNNNLTFDDVVDGVPEWLTVFAKAGKSLHGLMISTAFGCNYEGAVSHDTVLRIIAEIHKRVEDGGQRIREICLADTMGWASPLALKALVTKVREAFPGSEVSLHLHDTRGTAMANVFAGLEEGVKVFEASVGGMGGCPFARGAAGNVASEDVAFMCREMGISTGLSLEAYVEAARIAERIVGKELPGKLYKAWKYNRVE